MNSKIAFCVILLYNSSSIILAADNDSISSITQHFISLNSGLSSEAIRDDVMSPFIYRGKSIPVEVEYRYLGIRNTQLVSAYFNQLELKSKIPDYSNFGLVHSVQGITFDVRYAYLHKLSRLLNYNTTLFIGGEYHSLLNMRNHFFTAYSSYLMVDSFNSLSLSALLKKDFDDDKNYLFFNASVPILSYVLMGQTYNAYVGEKIETLDLGENVLTQVLKNGDFVSVNKLLLVKADISYIRSINKRFKFNVKYVFQYYSFSKYDDLFYSKNLSNRIMVGAIFKL